MKGGFVVSCQKLDEKLKKKKKKEYIEGRGSYRELAKKYNVSETAIEDVARPGKEAWRAQKKEFERKRTEKEIEKAAEHEANCAVLINRTAEMLVGAMAVQVNNRTLTSADAEIYCKAADALRKFKQIGGYKTKEELDEQLARIENLRANTELARSKIKTPTGTEEPLTFNFIFPDSQTDSQKPED